jgi:hypothetical protein
VNVAASVAGVNGIDPADEDDVTFEVQVYNAGDHPIVLSAATIAEQGFLPRHGPIIAAETPVPAHRWGQLWASTGRPACDVSFAVRHTLHVTARTVDGRTRVVAIPLADPAAVLGSTRGSYCSEPPDSEQLEGDLGQPLSFDVSQGRPVLRATLHIEEVFIEEVFIGQVPVVGGGHNRVFELRAPGKLPVTAAVGSPRTDRVPVELTVRRCVRITALTEDDLQIPIELYRLRQTVRQKIRAVAFSPPPAVVYLVELVHRTCD